MRFSSELFTKTRKDAPKDELSNNAKLLARSGFVSKQSAGVYAYMPLGLKVLRNIEKIIREEMNALGAQEVLLTTLQEPQVWEITGRWSDKVVDDWFKTKLRGGTELGLANTHEEALVSLLTQYVDSYQDLPLSVYQIQTKFRNELRAKSGLLRGREFLMKDMYSFSRSTQEHSEFYERAKEAYARIFQRVGIGEQTFVTVASGGTFSQEFSHEFQMLCEAGEDDIYLDPATKLAVNAEVYSEQTLASLGLSGVELQKHKAIEVGNIFSLGTKYSKPLELKFKNNQGVSEPVIMGCYGIGLGRLMGAIVESSHDEAGIIWPKSVAPAQVHLVSLGQTASEADMVYSRLLKHGVGVLYDDRDESAGVKLADADLMGLPYRLIVSQKSLASGSAELKERSSDQARLVKLDRLVEDVLH